ncbi:MAG: mechanosensitive ion channel family protein, partial [Spirochaeta sp.]|nr:mechanosensitive ion channel family protein [Spirochaeta sp.]
MESLLSSLALAELFQDLGLGRALAVGIERLLVVLLLLLGAVLADFIARKLLVRFIHGFFRGTRVSWDDRIADRGVLLRLSRVAPALVFYAGAALVAPELPWVVEAIRRVTTAWIVLVTAFTIDSFIDVFHDLYRESGADTRRPIKGLLQLGKVILFIVAGVVVLTTILNQSPFGVLGGIGAMSAVLMLVFRDSILGLVSGIQLSANNMVRIGDWIEMPKYDADGDVIDITLQSIKVQNWDKTITTIPIYALVSDSFRNWRGMSESGGRRIKRAVSID